MKIDEEKPIIKKQEKLKRKKQEKPHYVNAREFEDALIKYYDDDKITNYIGESLQKIATGLSYAPNFINYSFKDDMVGDAIVKMYQAVLHKKFKLNKGFSPFGYFTTIAYHAFICRIKKEKKHHEVVEEYKERNFDLMMQGSEDFTSHKVYTRPMPLDNSDYNF
jgi:DNA-directed RNA polymerase specialized sigma24 family protein